MIELNKGTIEEVVVDVVDLLENLATLSGTSPLFKVYKPDETDPIQTGTPTVDGLRALCLIDTTPDDYTPGEYDLYISFVTAPETPLLGPVKFRLNSL